MVFLNAGLRIKRVLTVLVVCVLPAVAHGQFDSLGLNTKWCEGIMVLNNNTELKGYIKHNDKLSLIKFKKNLDEEEVSFAESSIITMEYFDPGQSRHRKFAAFRVKVEEAGWTGNVFFEIMFEFESFAVLSKREPVNPAIRARNNNYSTSYVKVGYEQFERICLIGTDGKAEVLLIANEFERDRWSSSSSKIKHYFKKALLVKHMGPKWELVNTYVKKNKLRLKEKKDLMLALEYYHRLEKDRP